MSFCFPTRQQYGGDLQDRLPSQNFNNAAATDIPATAINQCRASLVGMTNTTFQAYIKFRFDSNSIVHYECSWDRARSVDPVLIAKVDTGQWLLGLPTTVIDQQGNVQIVQLSAIQCNSGDNNTTHMSFSTGQIVSNNQFMVYTFAKFPFGNATVFVDIFLY